ncbi:MAG: cyclase family protein [Bacteroidota bacterium]
MKVIDLTHPITENMRVYFPWHPATAIEQTASYSEHQCIVRRLTIGTHTGTHIDAPSHIFEGMYALEGYDPSVWYLNAQVLDFTPREPRREITAAELRRKRIRRRGAVIIKTGWDVRFGRDDFYATFPPLAEDAAEYLVSLRIRAVASDTPFTLAVHKILLRRGIPLITNLNNTGSLRAGTVRLIAAPLLIQGGDGAPARVLAVIPAGGRSR